MVKKTYRAFGRVIDRRTKQGISGLRIEAWDKDQKYDDLLGATVTDRKGGFQMSFDETYFREYYPEKSPDLFFKVYRGQKLKKSTEDSVIWNAETATEVTIDVEMPVLQPVGKDRVTARQVFKGIDLVQKSDFRGVWKEASDKTSTTLGFVKDMVMNTITKMDFEPLKVGTLKTGFIINQDIESARKNLEAQQVTVNEVKPYEPGLNAKSVADIAAFPMRLKPGQKVNLYEENGKVRYFSIVKVKEPKDTKIADSVKAQQTELNKLKKELETTKQESAMKDKQIASLRKEVKSLQTAQNEIKMHIDPEAIAQMGRDIKELQKFRASTEKSLKKRSKSTSA